MRLQKTASILVAIAAFAVAAPAEASATPAPKTGRLAHAGNHRHAHVRYAAAPERAGGSSGFVDLAEDRQSGAGFYPLPEPYRSGARRRRAIQYAGERNAIGAAIASEAIGYDFDEGYAFGNGHGVFNPVDGVGTPFFAGYYS
jgi:hypothetical protein